MAELNVADARETWRKERTDTALVTLLRVATTAYEEGSLSGPETLADILRETAESLDPAPSEGGDFLGTVAEADAVAEQGACILTPENIHTADDCTLHDHERPE